MGLADPDARPLDRVARERWAGDRLEQLDELRESEGVLQSGASIDDRGRHVGALEADDEVERLEVELGDVPGAVIGEVEAEAAADRDGLRQRGDGPEVERAERGDAYRESPGFLLQQRGRQGAAKAVARADECDFERRVAQRKCPSSKPTRFSIPSWRERTSGPSSRGAARSRRAFQTSRGSLGQRAAASR